MAKKRRRHVGTIVGRGSKSFLGALFSGDGLSALVPVIAGAALGVGATAAIRMFVKPLNDDGTPNPFWKFAPAAGAASGLLTGAGFYFFGGKKSSALLSAVVGATLPNGALLANEAWNRHLAASTDGETQALWTAMQTALLSSGGAAAPAAATTDGLGVIVPRMPQMMGVSLGRMPGARILQGTSPAGYGQSIYHN